MTRPGIELRSPEPWANTTSYYWFWWKEKEAVQTLHTLYLKELFSLGAYLKKLFILFLLGMGSIPLFIISSVTPWTYDYNHNPAVWLVSYDRQSMTPSKIDQYYVDLLQANRLKSLDYRLEYSIPSEYKMGNISAESLLDLRTRMESNDSLFGKYMRHMFADVTTKKKPEITLDLKIKVLCAMNSMDKKSFGACKAHGIKPVNNTLKVSINTILLLNIFILTILTLGYSTFL